MHAVRLLEAPVIVQQNLQGLFSHSVDSRELAENTETKSHVTG